MCFGLPKVGGSRPSRAARRRPVIALIANIEAPARGRGASASGAQGEPPSEAGVHSPDAVRRAARMWIPGRRPMRFGAARMWIPG
jgi:hypothetical protein